MDLRKETVDDTRGKFRQRIGEIIEATIGLDGVRKIFEAAENGDSKAEMLITAAGVSGQPASGIIAMKLGLDPEIKNALLTAQAAENTLLSLEQIQTLYEDHLPVLKQQIADFKYVPDPSLDAFELHVDSLISHHDRLVEDYFRDNISEAQTNHPSFQFISPEKDPEALVRAQATHQLAAHYEENEKCGLQEALIDQYMKVPDYAPFGLKYMDSFKASVSRSYREAGEILSKHDYAQVGRKMQDVAASISYDPEMAKKYTVDTFVEDSVHMHRHFTNKVNVLLDPMGERFAPYHYANEKWIETMHLRRKQALGFAA